MKKTIILALLVAFLLAGCVAPEETAPESDVDVNALDADITELEDALQDLSDLEDLEVPDINEELFE